MPENSDPYTYPGSEVLRNLAGIRDAQQLAVYEADLTASRLAELSVKPVNGRFDAAHLRSIHKFIFQDVFSWAGEFRTVNISKGDNFFGAAPFIGTALEDVLRRLPEKTFGRGMDARSFAQHAACYLGEINAIHPFREGNQLQNRG